MVQWNKTVPRWAGTTVEPPESKKDEGYIVGDRPPAMWENWFRKGISESVAENRSVIEGLDSGKAEQTWVEDSLSVMGNVKADKSWTQTELNKKATITALDSGLNLKADKSWVTTELNKKATITALNSGLGLKANQTDLTAGLDLKADKTALTGHTSRTNNPHGVTKAQVGLDKVDNTSDASKPISLATATALELKADLSFVNDELGKIATGTALNTHINKTDNPHGVTKAQVNLGNVDNTSDANKPISTATQTALDGKVTANANITAGVYGKVAVDKKGLVTAGYDLEESDIPNLGAGKINSGTLGVDRIPSLNASKITAGTLGTARIPNLDAGKITTGVLGVARIPNLDAGKITSGAFDSARIPNLSATKITSGTFTSARIPTLAISKITNLRTSLDAKLTATTAQFNNKADKSYVDSAIQSAIMDSWNGVY